MPRRAPKVYEYEKDKVVCPNRYTSKVIEYCLMFQTNLNFFVSPRMENGYAIYKIYPGIVYLKFNVMKKNTKSSPIFLTISKFELYPETFTIYDEPEITAQIPPELYDYIIKDPKAPEVLRVVLEAMPKDKEDYAYIGELEHFGYCHYVELLEKIKNYLESLSVTIE